MMGVYDLGVDVNRYEPLVDGAAAARAGVKFVAVRVTVGDYYTDPTWLQSWQQAQAANIPVTGYHVLTPDRPAEGQVGRFLREVQGRAPTAPLGWVLDCELDRGQNITKIIAQIKACLDLLTDDGTWPRPMIYTSSGWWDTWAVLRGKPPVWCAEYRLWVAHFTPYGLPRLPLGWLDWTIWQYSESGKFVPGVPGTVDLNRWNGRVDW